MKYKYCPNCGQVVSRHVYLFTEDLFSQCSHCDLVFEVITEQEARAEHEFLMSLISEGEGNAISRPSETNEQPSC